MRTYFPSSKTILLLTAVGLIFLSGCTQSPEITPMPEPTRDPILEESIIQDLEGINAEAVPIYLNATDALDSGDYERALILYEQLADLAPEFSTVYRRISYLESLRGNVSGAIDLARTAVEMDPNGYNQMALAMALMDKNTPKDSREAFNMASAAAEKLPDDEQAIFILILTAGDAFEYEVLRESTQRLLELSPGNPFAHYVAGTLAANDGKWLKSERELLISQELGMPPEAIQEVMDYGVAWNVKLIRTIIWGVVATLVWLLGLGILYFIGVLLSKATIKELNNEDQQIHVKLSRREKNLRSVYRSVIRILSMYFYISIPFVIILLLILVGGAYYFFSMIGFIPIYVVGLLGIVLIVSLFALLRSLFRRFKDTPPGLLLDRARVPDLWHLNDYIAQKLDAVSVDAIYLTPGTGIAVSETGSMLKKFRGTGRRNLILGMGVLPGLSQGQFAAVLAHEYGHFSNRDTAGGKLAYRVYSSLDHLAQRLVSGGAAMPFNPVWLFVITYQRIYLRVTLGASRLLEVLADRFAALSMGSEILIAGITNIVRESIRFNLRANKEIKNSLESKIGLSNLYNLSMDEELESEFDKIFAEEMDKETSDFDSHPALKERISRIKAMRTADKPILNNDLPLLDLIPDAGDLQRQMTMKITDQLPDL